MTPKYKIRLHTIAAAFFLAALLCTACDKTAISAASNGTTVCQTPPNGSGPFTYVAIGASDAVGFGAQCMNSQGYVPLLFMKMPKGTHLINLGIFGETAGGALSAELPAAIQAHPNIITIWLAANDLRSFERSGTPTLAQYSQQLNTLLQSLRQQTNAKVFVANLPQLIYLPAFQKGSTSLAVVQQQNTTWNNAIAAVVQQNKDYLVNLYAMDLANHQNYIFSDGFHPSTLGYQALANLFWTAITASGGV